ncbi:MAG: aminotransferase class III-fold pyridoxal phosphate-dependent enzyme, partial [Flavobacteriaceae bacterium]|nr:aminotransferase class III-fold pyridoxal phosphate-dependent enzyme [Flavobacteriaceae bacterium]
EDYFEENGKEIAAVIIEGIQGVGGINVAEDSFLSKIRALCDEYGAVYIADSVQCGFGRSGKFFSHDFAGVNADIYTMAKGMGNGFPVAGLIIAPHIKPKHFQLGTTFGGNHLACAAGIAVLDVLEKENLMYEVNELSAYFIAEAQKISQVKKIKGRGLMLGLEFDFEVGELRKKMIYEKHIFTGGANNKHLLRILPPLTVKKQHIDTFFEALKDVLQTL